MSDSNQNSKTYPAATPEVAAMFGIGKNQDSAPEVLPQDNSLPKGTLSVADLAVVAPDLSFEDNSSSGNVQSQSKQPAQASNQQTPAIGNSAPAAEDVIAKDIAAAKNSRSESVLRVVAPYLIVFVLGVFLYVFFFRSVDFSSILKSQSKAVTSQQSVLAQLEQQNLASYNTWISTFYFDVSDAKIINPETDNSGNGLTNFQKYLLNLNPKSYDTLGLGRSDTETLAMGLNPLTGDALTDAQKLIINKYIDLEVAMNRLSLSHMQNPALNVQPQGASPQQQTVAGAQTQQSIRGPVTTTTPTPAQTDTQVNFGGAQTAYAIAPTSNNDLNAIDINTNIPGRLQISSLKIDVPIVWTSDPNNFETDLQNGVVHYPGTAMPGEVGTTYIAGHSSNYIWAKGNYNRIFSHLGDLANDTSFSITVTQTNGKQAIFHYVVTNSQQFSPTDQAQFQNTGKSVIALSTCWPVGSTAKRLVVFGQLTQVEK